MNAEEILKKYATGERTFAGVNLNEANLSGANLSHAELSQANLSVANLSGSNLSHANLSGAKLNVTKLSGANLSHANLTDAILNVANLAMADLSYAEMSNASLVRAELTRTDLSGANLNRANLSGADLKDAKLRGAVLSNANLSRSDLKWAVFTAATLSGANLHGTDLSSADLSSADLSNTELRQANLSRVNLQGANLSGANLRWADLSGADLRWADLSGAKLSGANLTGANLSYANLNDTSLVHVDLTRANLIGADWVGADLSGATLTGTKLHNVPRFGIKTDGVICEWVDLSPNGDQSIVQRIGSDHTHVFFRESPPTVNIQVDAALDHDTNMLLAATYRQLMNQSKLSFLPPNLQLGRRRTTLTFEMMGDNWLFLAAYIVILPFKDAAQVQVQLAKIVEFLQAKEVANYFHSEGYRLVASMRETFLSSIHACVLPDEVLVRLGRSKFFKAPSRMSLLSSSGKVLKIHHHPRFGSRLIQENDGIIPNTLLSDRPTPLPEFGQLMEFIQAFDFTSDPPQRSVS